MFRKLKYFSLGILLLIILSIGMVGVGASTTTKISPTSDCVAVNDSSNGQSNAWDTPPNALTDDGIDATASCSGTGCHVYSVWLKITNWSASIPDGATIDGIEVVVENQMYDLYGAYGRVSLVNSMGNILDSVKVENSGSAEEYRSYGNSSYLWKESWTASDINDEDFGFVFEGDSGAGPGSAAYVYVDYAYINVTYTEDSCTCPGSDENWEIDHSDACTITEACDLGTGNLSFTGEGTTTCDANINVSNLGDPSSNGKLLINDECYIIVG